MDYTGLMDMLSSNPYLVREILNDRRAFDLALRGIITREKQPPAIIFLDIDEVIQTRRAHLKGFSIDPDAVLFIKRVCKEHNAKIVVCSTWRSHMTSGLTAGAIVEAFGFDTADLFYSDNRHDEVFYKTNNKHGNLGKTAREHQILDWLAVYPEITNFVIIDDSFCQFNDLVLRAVCPDPYEGFGVRDYYRCKYILSGYDDKYLEETRPFKSQGVVSETQTYLEKINYERKLEIS